MFLAHPRLPIRYLEPLATTRWENAAGIHDYARKLQGGGTDVTRLPKRDDRGFPLARPSESLGLPRRRFLFVKRRSVAGRLPRKAAPLCSAHASATARCAP